MGSSQLHVIPDARMEIIMANLALLGAPVELLRKWISVLQQMQPGT